MLAIRKIIRRKSKKYKKHCEKFPELKDWKYIK